MAKKSRRARGSGRQPRLSAAQMVQPEAPDSVSVDSRTATALADPDADGLRAEYQYVVSDLRRIGIIAAAMLAILVLLAVLLT